MIAQQTWQMFVRLTGGGDSHDSHHDPLLFKQWSGQSPIDGLNKQGVNWTSWTFQSQGAEVAEVDFVFKEPLASSPSVEGEVGHAPQGSMTYHESIHLDHYGKLKEKILVIDRKVTLLFNTFNLFRTCSLSKFIKWRNGNITIKK